MSNPLPSSARSALREAAETLQKALDWRDAEREKDPLSLDFVRASLAVVEERRAYQTLFHPKTVLALLLLAERGAEDTARIDWLDARLKTESPWMDFVLAADFQDGVWISRINRGDYRGAIAIDNSSTPLAGVREAIDAASSPTGGTTE